MKGGDGGNRPLVDVGTLAQDGQNQWPMVMTGRRARQMLRDDMDRRFYRLRQFLGGYLHEGWPYLHGTPEKAVETAIEECAIESRQRVRRELHAVLSEVTDDKEFLEVLNSGLGVNVHFKEPEEARTFAQDVEAKLMRSITEHFGKALDSRG